MQEALYGIGVTAVCVCVVVCLCLSGEDCDRTVRTHVSELLVADPTVKVRGAISVKLLQPRTGYPTLCISRGVGTHSTRERSL